MGCPVCNDKGTFPVKIQDEEGKVIGIDDCICDCKNPKPQKKLKGDGTIDVDNNE